MENNLSFFIVGENHNTGIGHGRNLSSLLAGRWSPVDGQPVAGSWQPRCIQAMEMPQAVYLHPGSKETPGAGTPGVCNHVYITRDQPILLEYFVI